MPIIFGGTTVEKVVFGGTEVDKVVFNGVTVFESKPQLATPQNVTADGMNVSWDEVENATSYEVLADGASIGTVTPSTGETWVLNTTITAPSNSIDEYINFLCVGTSQNFIRITIYSEGPGVHLEYFAQGDSPTSGTYVSTGGIEVANEYRTLTFETAPTGDLLTWLTANGVKQ